MDRDPSETSRLNPFLFERVDVLREVVIDRAQGGFGGVANDCGCGYCYCTGGGCSCAMCLAMPAEFPDILRVAEAGALQLQQLPQKRFFDTSLQQPGG
jgi:hypothetical protein